MAILSARAVDGLLQECQGLLTDEQQQFLIDRLNRTNSESLNAEWELIILTALSFVGVVVYEPSLGGMRKLDFQFDEPMSGVKLFGDVTAPSDDELVRNSVGLLSQALPAELDKRGIRGRTIVTVGCKMAGRTMRPYLPDPHEFKKYIFNNEFHAFVRAIRAAPGQEHSLEIDNEKAQVSVKFAPGHWSHMMSCRNFRMARDIEKNVIHNALKSKNDQIKASGHIQGDGWRCVVLCDGGCAALVGKKDWSTFSSRDIISEYLRRHRSLDLVVSVGIQARTDSSELEFGVQAYGNENDFGADVVSKLFC
jgi:hypothetical protein